MRMPVEVISDQLDTKLDEIFEHYKKNNPQINPEKIFYEARLVFQFGRLNPEFSLMLIVFDEDGTLEFKTSCEENDFLYDEIGSVLKIKQYQNEKRDLLEALEMFYKIIYLGEGFDEED